MSLKSHEARKLAVAGIAAVALLSAGASSAQAAGANLTLQYSCNYPLIGAQPLAIAINASIPDSVPAQQQTPAFAINAVAATGGQTTAGLQTLGVTSLESAAGTAAKATITQPGGATLPLTVPINVANQPSPLTGTVPVALKATGQTPPLSFPKAGNVPITVGNVHLNLIAKNADGVALKLPPVGVDSDGDPTTFDVDCTLAPSSQDNTLANLTVTDAGSEAPEAPAPTIPATPTASPGNASTLIDYGYNLAGSATLKNLILGSLPLSGGINAHVTLPSGAFTGDLTLAKTQGNLQAVGILPVTAYVQIVPTEQVTGKLTGGKLTATAKIRIKLTKVALFGIQIAGGATCQTDQVSTVSLHSTDKFFYPLSGGTLAGTFPIGNISNCGILTGIVSPLTQGPGNAIVLKLNPLA